MYYNCVFLNINLFENSFISNLVCVRGAREEPGHCFISCLRLLQYYVLAVLWKDYNFKIPAWIFWDFLVCQDFDKPTLSVDESKQPKPITENFLAAWCQWRKKTYWWIYHQISATPSTCQKHYRKRSLVIITRTPPQQLLGWQIYWQARLKIFIVERPAAIWPTLAPAPSPLTSHVA